MHRNKKKDIEQIANKVGCEKNEIFNGMQGENITNVREKIGIYDGMQGEIITGIKRRGQDEKFIAKVGPAFTAR